MRSGFRIEQNGQVSALEFTRRAGVAKQSLSLETTGTIKLQIGQSRAVDREKAPVEGYAPPDTAPIDACGHLAALPQSARDNNAGACAR